MTPPYFGIFVTIPPLKRAWPLDSLHQRMICSRFDWNWLAGSGEEKWFSLLWPHSNPGTMICTNLNLHYIRRLLCTSELFWPCFLRRRFLNDPTLFLHSCDYLPFEEDLALDLYNFRFPLSKDDLYQVWLKLARWFWRRFLKIFSEFLSPLREGGCPSFIQF
jgi:hypothetical protein